MSWLSMYDRDCSFHCVALYVPDSYQQSRDTIRSKGERTNDERVFGQLLEEAFLGRAVNVEVECLGVAYESCQAQQARERIHGVWTRSALLR